MDEIKFDIRLDDVRKTVVGAQRGKSIFEFKAAINNVRALHSTITEFSRILADLEDYFCVIILDDPKISQSRFQQEWEILGKILNPEIFKRLCLVIFSNSSLKEQYGKITQDDIIALPEIRRQLLQRLARMQTGKTDSYLEILRVLLINWFRSSGPLKLNQLKQLTGFSYPTVASALVKIGPLLIRHPDRSVELNSFPRDQWLRMLAGSQDLRQTRGFWSPRPRPVDNLIERIREHSRPDIAFGGIIAARKYKPGIDLFGIPRIDISILDLNNVEIDDFISSIDPGLRQVRIGELPQVVVHVISRPASLFLETGGTYFADEVECLMDLHETRLEAQAGELLDHLILKAET